MSDFEVQWIELLSSQRSELEKFGKDLNIHPLAIEDCLHSNQRAKFEDYENHQLLVWFGYFEGKTYELEFIVFEHIVILVTSESAPGGKLWRDFLNISRTHRDGNHMVHQALDRALDLSVQSIQPLFAKMDDYESIILESTLDPRELLALKRQLSQAEFTMAFLSSVVAQWQRFLSPKDDLRWRLRDLWDHAEREHHALVFHRMQIASAMEMYWGVTAKRTNDQIKKLTLIASVSVPLGFWTSFWGMNFQAIPFHEPWLFRTAIGVMVVSIGGVYYLLRRRGFWER